MLNIVDLTVEYHGLEALKGVSISVAENEFVAVLGANGAGKSSLFKAISGVVKYRCESMTFFEHNLVARRPYERHQLRVSHVPEGRHVFPTMTVRDNILTGFGAARPDDEGVELVLDLFPRLAERLHQRAGTLSGGEQQMLAIARGLVSRPRLLMLDEPSMGLAPAIAEEIFDRLRGLREMGDMSVLLVEQRATQALELASRVYVLQTGSIVYSGTPAGLEGNQELSSAYFGI